MFSPRFKVYAWCKQLSCTNNFTVKWTGTLYYNIQLVLSAPWYRMKTTGLSEVMEEQLQVLECRGIVFDHRFSLHYLFSTILSPLFRNLFFSWFLVTTIPSQHAACTRCRFLLPYSIYKMIMRHDEAFFMQCIFVRPRPLNPCPLLGPSRLNDVTACQWGAGPLRFYHVVC